VISKRLALRSCCSLAGVALATRVGADTNCVGLRPPRYHLVLLLIGVVALVVLEFAH
jgi:hypothetical protein